MNNIAESIILEIYESLPYGRVVPIIEKYSDDRITDTLIENALKENIEAIEFMNKSKDNPYLEIITKLNNL